MRTYIMVLGRLHASYFYKGLRPFLCLEYKATTYPRYFIRDLPLDVSPECASYDTRSRIGFFSDCVGVCWAVVPSFHHVQPYYLSRYFWRLYLDNKVNI